MPIIIKPPRALSGVHPYGASREVTPFFQKPLFKSTMVAMVILVSQS
jgi:hypothetical protein